MPRYNYTAEGTGAGNAPWRVSGAVENATFPLGFHGALEEVQRD